MSSEWEFDERRGDLVKNYLIPKEELVWYESDDRFDSCRPHGTILKKTLRRLDFGATFLVQDEYDKVLTVGTFNYE